MVGTPVAPPPVLSRVMLIGQAPGPREASIGRPFAWTAGRTLFSWFQRLGVDEATVRSRCYIAAVCRCFPGKAPSGGDRVPGRDEIAACSVWLRREVELLKPALIIPIGRLAIEQVLPPAPLDTLIGRSFRVTLFGHASDCVPLPHPSGASTWFRREPGIALLADALALIGRHPAWRQGIAAPR